MTEITPQPNKQMPPPPAFSIVPQGCDGFSALFHIEEMVALVMPAGEELPEGSHAAAPGDVIATISVHHDGAVEIVQTVEPWEFKTLYALGELGSLFYKAHELAEQMIGVNWTAPKRVVKLG